ncbi:MAG: tRNA (adenosine(37)-N6)-threonylcarbamoyltransferase complex ATPase subunit type 1 TsaE, partial [Oscillospiraceae bacterium]|nr:tRNA (adenosine(37)-N6)-threonylcarbamoyltransferase complex ATPase subunit type 1 TsaE [Oscillospiraceae bacterium]
TIVNEYDGPVPLFHFDMYRLGGPEELFDIGWDDYLDRGGVCAVEWSERISEALPEGTVTVSIARHEENEDWRRITIEGVELP